MIEHHLVVLSSDAGLLVAAEGRMGGIGVVAIGPDPAGLDCTAEPVGAIAVAGPYSGAEPIERVVGDRERILVVLESRDRNDRPENLFLEDAHLVVAFEDRRLDIISLGELAIQLRPLAAGQHLGAFLFAD